MNQNRKTYLSNVMRDANVIAATAKIPRGDAMKKAYLVATLTGILSTGAAADITFVKADGSIREMRALPARVGEGLVKGTGKSAPKANMLCIDAALCEFRSFKKANLLTVTAA